MTATVVIDRMGRSWSRQFMRSAGLSRSARLPNSQITSVCTGIVGEIAAMPESDASSAVDSRPDSVVKLPERLRDVVLSLRQALEERDEAQLDLCAVTIKNIACREDSSPSLDEILRMQLAFKRGNFELAALHLKKLEKILSLFSPSDVPAMQSDSCNGSAR